MTMREIMNLYGLRFEYEDGVYFIMDSNDGIVGSGFEKESAFEDARENLGI